ncbi:cbb3-type cytochrome c oxidase subunit 3 [Pseudomonas fontis]|uniref:Cbb3-type cytochrome c oxidase subunit 3 n=1 Tax=Pseudomonas fontis TaxID=2942633 RepID=A0ABT5NR80_9PSED|nr:cbb3-type cytochrome c oxidase subunit 3 [Pseudomonas fontis]MDD0977295.1 cbb3-type cytochrome c oxidase subunit 3 [Pseudomonas fontis]MDD0990668.1 cbb3-type cytochrome c oxidase subunit 3 [Pseudomonas fontis]
MNEWLYGLYCLSGVLFFYLITAKCLQRHDLDVEDQASLIPFADDPAVARRVEKAIGKAVPASAPDAALDA